MPDLIDIIEVRTDEEIDQFHQVQRRIYADDLSWVSPVVADVERVFDANSNSFHEHGIIKRWLAKVGDECVGRVAAFINLRTAQTFKQPTGGMGFFESIHCEAVAFALLDTCKNWLEQFGIKAMDGPINFGENNAWWGLVVDGFEPPLFRHNYNPTYYKKFFESYGFRTYFEQYYYTFDLQKGLNERYYRFGEKLAENPEFQCKHVDLRRLGDFAEDFRHVYNLGWQTHDNFKEMTRARALDLFASMKPVVDADLIWFLYHKGQPIGFVLMLPELNGILRRFRAGKFAWFEKLTLKLILALRLCRTAYGSVIGFAPQYQNKGLETLLFYHIHQKVVLEKKYDTLKIGWAGDFNPRVVNLYRKLGFQKVQTSRTYRKIFDPKIPFERSPIIS